jgi:hypothetical protein
MQRRPAHRQGGSQCCGEGLVKEGDPVKHRPAETPGPQEDRLVGEHLVCLLLPLPVLYRSLPLQLSQTQKTAWIAVK